MSSSRLPRSGPRMLLSYESSNFGSPALDAGIVSSTAGDRRYSTQDAVRHPDAQSRNERGGGCRASWAGFSGVRTNHLRRHRQRARLLPRQRDSTALGRSHGPPNPTCAAGWIDRATQNLEARRPCRPDRASPETTRHGSARSSAPHTGARIDRIPSRTTFRLPESQSLFALSQHPHPSR